MIKIQQGLASLLLTTICTASYAVLPAPVTTPSTATPTTTPAQDTTTQPAKNDAADNSTTTVYADAPGDTTAEPAGTHDPYESFNRPVFHFNETLDKYIMKPIATGYNTIMPRPLNQGVHNFFNNIGTLPTLANDLLQFNFYQAANDTWRILINTTVGVGGLFDVASRIGLKYYSNDFGLTMAAWGYENSNYLVLPFFGPSTPRDGIGLPVDYFAFSLYPYIYPQSTRFQMYGLGVVDRRAQLLKFQEVLDEASLDKYVFVRNAYMQRRAHQIEENQHLGYNEREKNGEPVAEATSEQTDAAASVEATAEPIQPSDQPIAPTADASKVTKPTKQQPANAA